MGAKACVSTATATFEDRSVMQREHFNCLFGVVSCRLFVTAMACCLFSHLTGRSHSGNLPHGQQGTSRTPVEPSGEGCTQWLPCWMLACLTYRYKVHTFSVRYASTVRRKYIHHLKSMILQNTRLTPPTEIHFALRNEFLSLLRHKTLSFSFARTKLREQNVHADLRFRFISRTRNAVDRQITALITAEDTMNHSEVHAASGDTCSYGC